MKLEHLVDKYIKTGDKAVSIPNIDLDILTSIFNRVWNTIESATTEIEEMINNAKD